MRLTTEFGNVNASHHRKLHGGRLVGVEANTTDVIWSTPYEDLYPQGVGT